MNTSLVRAWSSSIVSCIVTAGALLLPAARAEAAVSATVVNFELLVFGDASNNVIFVRLAQGDPTRIQVVSENALVGTFLRSGIVAIRILGQEGADQIAIEPINGPITEPARIEGGPGSDNITGGAGPDIILAGTGSDIIFWHANGNGGADFIEGDGDGDTLFVNGSNAVDTLTAEPNGLRLRVTHTPGNTVLDVGSIEGLTLRTHGGNDTINYVGNLAAIINGVVAEGGDGNDSIFGSNGADFLFGDGGDDLIAGLFGNDDVHGGAGDDLIVWTPGDGNDTVDGEAGTDRARVSGNGGNEAFSVASTGPSVEIRRDNVPAIGNVKAETIEIRAASGNDLVSAGAGLPGVTSLIFAGEDGNDELDGSSTNDTLDGGPGVDTINGFGGNDTITPGPGDDFTVTGGAGDDLFIWNAGDGVDSFNGESGGSRSRRRTPCRPAGG